MHHVSDIVTDPTIAWVQRSGPPGALVTRAGAPVRFDGVGVRESVSIRVVIEPAGEEIITAHPVR